MKKLVPFSDTTSYLYHSVDDKGYEFAMRYGLVADSDGFIYLSKYPIKNPNYTHTFRVRIPNMNNLRNWEDFWTDDDGELIDFDHEPDPNNPYYIYVGDIDAKHIQEV